MANGYDQYGNWLYDLPPPPVAAPAPTPTPIPTPTPTPMPTPTAPASTGWQPGEGIPNSQYLYNSAPGMGTGTNPFYINSFSPQMQSYYTGQNADLGNVIGDWVNAWNSFKDPTQAFDWANQHYTLNGNSWSPLTYINQLYGTQQNQDPLYAPMLQYASDYAAGPKDWGPSGYSQYWGANPGGAAPGAVPSPGATWDPSIGGWRDVSGNPITGKAASSTSGSWVDSSGVTTNTAGSTINAPLINGVPAGAQVTPSNAISQYNNYLNGVTPATLAQTTNQTTSQTSTPTFTGVTPSRTTPGVNLTTGNTFSVKNPFNAAPTDVSPPTLGVTSNNQSRTQQYTMNPWKGWRQ